MIKKKYQQPAMQVIAADFKQQILSSSLRNVTTIGLGDDNLTKDGEGDSWNDAMSRRHNVWNAEAEEDW